MATDVPEIDKKNRRDYLKLAVSVITFALVRPMPERSSLSRPVTLDRSWMGVTGSSSSRWFQPVVFNRGQIFLRHSAAMTHTSRLLRQVAHLAALIIHHGLTNLLGSVHDKRALSDNRLIDWRAAKQ